jgi:hypothetical protein
MPACSANRRTLHRPFHRKVKRDAERVLIGVRGQVLQLPVEAVDCKCDILTTISFSQEGRAGVGTWPEGASVVAFTTISHAAVLTGILSLGQRVRGEETNKRFSDVKKRMWTGQRVRGEETNKRFSDFKKRMWTRKRNFWNYLLSRPLLWADEPLVPNCDNASISMILVLHIILWYGVQALVERTPGTEYPYGTTHVVIQVSQLSLQNSSTEGELPLICSPPYCSGLPRSQSDWKKSTQQANRLCIAPDHVILYSSFQLATGKPTLICSIIRSA